jgi:hypothetical protein
MVLAEFPEQPARIMPDLNIMENSALGTFRLDRDGLM